jgi:hypothetical protein
MYLKIYDYFKKQEKTKYRDLESYWLVALGIPSFLVAAYLGYLVKGATERLIPPTNEYGISIESLTLWAFIGIFALGVWMFGCIAARCHLELFDRWFS